MKSLEKIKENYIFRRAYSRGSALVSPYAVVYVMNNRFGNVRLGITVGKKIGNAVCRNRAKRVITAAFRECLPYISKGHDIVIVARTRILNVKSTDVLSEFKRLLTSSGVYAQLENNE